MRASVGVENSASFGNSFLIRALKFSMTPFCLGLASSDLPAIRESWRVGQFVRENRIVVERTPKFAATTDSDHWFEIAPNLLDRDVAAAGPNRKWVSDIREIWTREGRQCLVMILDLNSRRMIVLRIWFPKLFRVTSWAVSNRMGRDLLIAVRFR